MFWSQRGFLSFFCILVWLKNTEVKFIIFFKTLIDLDLDQVKVQNFNLLSPQSLQLSSNEIQLAQYVPIHL